MRILDDASDNRINQVSIFLTKQEALQFLGYVEQLLEDPNTHHSHLSSEDYQKEITISLYDLNDLYSFHPRAKKLILEDE